MKLKSALLPALALALALPALTLPARAQTVAGAPAYIDYQGMVFDGTETTKPLGSTGTSGNYVAAPTNYTMQFKIYDSQSATTGLIWAESQTVTVSLGAFSVRLGSGAAITTPTALPHGSIADAFNGKDRYLELTVFPVGSSTGTPITPRLAFQSSPFSFVAQRAVLADEVKGKVTATAGSTFTGTTAQPTTFTGPISAPGGITGNVTGNVTGSASTAGTATYAGSAGSAGSATTATIATIAGNVSGIVSVANGGTGSNTKNFVDTSTSQLNIKGNKGFYDWVSINGSGSTTPTAPLDVRGYQGITQNYAWFIRGATTNSVQTGVNNNYQWYSIVAEQSISAHQFCSTSDARIKEIVGGSDGQQDLATIQRLHVTDYRMVDKLGLGDELKKGFIAQEVEQVVPEAVTMGTGFIPDVYTFASSVKWNAANQNLTLTMPKAHGLKAGDRVRLSADDEAMDLTVVEVPSALVVVLEKCERDLKLVFVFGKQVQDLRTVNYDRIFTTGIGAIQQIKKEKDAEVKALQEENRALRASLAAQEKRLVSLETKDQARDAKLARLEKLLDAPANIQPVTTALSSNR